MSETSPKTTRTEEASDQSVKVHDTSIQDPANASTSFFNILQTEVNTEIPTYVRNILRLSNLDKPITFSCITNDTFAELESFAREQMKDFLRRGDNLEDFYGRYHKMPDKFKFLIGDRYLINQLVTLVKSKSQDFWRTNTTTAVIQPFNQVFIRACGEEASSDFDDEEPEQKKPIDAATEQRELTRLVRNVVLREVGEKTPLASKVKVKVTMKKTFDEQMNQEKIILTGYIKCVVCKVTLTIRKNTFGNYKKPRWVVSNFRRHMRFHVQKGAVSESDLNPKEESNDQSAAEIDYLESEDQGAGGDESVDADEEEMHVENYAVAWSVDEV